MVIKKDNVFFWLLRIYVYVQVFSESQLNDLPSMDMLLSVLRYVLLFSFLAFDLSSKLVGKKNTILNAAAFLGVILLNAFLVDGGSMVITLFLVVWASKGKSLKRIFKNYMIDLVSAHLFVAFLCGIGILDNTVDTRWIGSYAGAFFSGEYVRHSMGFIVHNQIPTTFLLVFLLYIVFRGKMITIKETLFIIVCNFLIYVYFGSRITLILVIVSLALYWVIRIKVKMFGKNQKPIITKMAYLAYPIFCILSLIFTAIYDDKNKTLNYLNLFLNNRLIMGHKALESYSINLLGYGNTAGTYTTLIDSTVDNGYVLMFLQRGVIIGIIVLILYELLVHIGIKKNNTYLLLMLMFLASENMINAHMFTYKLIPLYCILTNSNNSMLIYEYKEKKKKWKGICKLKFRLYKIEEC